MKRLLLIPTVLLALTIAHGQATFQKTYGGTSSEFGNAVQQTNDNGFIAVGSTRSFGAGSSDVFLIKTDANGDTMWTKTFGGTNKDWGSSVQQTNDGGYIIGGKTGSFGAGSGDIYLIKTDSSGNTLWTKIFGTSEQEFCGSVIQTTDGGYCIAGSTGNVVGGNSDVYLIKTDTNGDSIWTKKFGGNNNDFAYSLQQTIDGGYIISGTTYNSNSQYDDVYLIKTNNAGVASWTKTFDESGHVNGNSVSQTGDSGYVIGGTTAGNFYALKVDSNGTKQWSKQIDAGGDDRCFSIIRSSDNGFVMAGYSRIYPSDADVLIVKLDGNGNSLWSKKFGGIQWDESSMIQPTMGGGFIIVGRTESYGAGSSDIYLIKTDCNNFPMVNISTSDTTEFCQGDSVSATFFANILTGVTYQWIKDDSVLIGATSYSYVATEEGDYKLTVTDSNGCSNVSSNSINISVYPFPAKPQIIQYGDTLNAGYFFVTYQWYLNDSIIPGATSPTYIITQSGIYKVELAWGCKSISDEFYAVVSGISSIVQQLSITIYPNPFNSSATLRLGKNIKDVTLTVYNLYGQTVKQIKNISGQTITLYRDNLPGGLYFIRLTQDNKIITADKLVITN